MRIAALKLGRDWIRQVAGEACCAQGSSPRLRRCEEMFNVRRSFVIVECAFGAASLSKDCAKRHHQ
jgi:hypothetical protein